MKNIIIDSVVYLFLGMIIWFVGFYNFEPHLAETTKEAMRFYSDCCIIPGIILICLFLLQFFGRKGAYDGVTYSLRYVGQALLPFLVKPLDKDGYYEYKKLKAETRKELRISGLFVGLAFVLAAIVFYILYTVF